MGLQIVHVFP